MIQLNLSEKDALALYLFLHRIHVPSTTALWYGPDFTQGMFDNVYLPLWRLYAEHHQ